MKKLQIFQFIFIVLITNQLQIEMKGGMQFIKFISKLIPSSSYNTNGKNNSVLDCKTRIQRMIRFNSQDPLFGSFLRNSGKRLNDLGNFEECNKNPNTTYFVFVVQYMLPEPISKIGICLPKVCTEESLYYLMNEALIPILDKFVSSIEGVPITIKNPIEFSQSLSKHSYGFYITIVIFVLWLSIVLFGTIADYYLSLTSANGSNKRIKISIFKYIDCFSLKRNVESVLKVENRINSKLNALQFLRCICIYWVVVGHTFLNMVLGNTYNMLEAFDNIMNHKGMAILRSATVAVDVFFTLSGFLSAMTFFSSFERIQKRNLYNLYLFYSHRYIRLFPMMILSWSLAVYIIPHSSSGADLNFVSLNCKLCYSRFFQTFLYLDNFFTTMVNFCNNWIWYLYVDMQLFIVTPLIVYPALKNLKIGLFWLLILFLSSFGYQIYLFQKDSYQASVISPTGPETDGFYAKAYTRCNTYFIGIFFYYLYYEYTKEKLDDSKNKSLPVAHSNLLNIINKMFCSRVPRYLLISIGIGFMAFTIFFQNHYDQAISGSISQSSNTLFLLFNRILFVLGLMLIIYPILIGFCRPLYYIFSFPIFNILGKITYGTYMLHLLLIEFTIGNSKSSISYNCLTMIYLGTENFVLAYIISFIATIVFESPIVQLQKFTSPKVNRPNKSLIKNQINLDKENPEIKKDY